MQVFIGKLVHSLSSDELEILDVGAVGVGSDGKIRFVQKIGGEDDLNKLLAEHDVKPEQVDIRRLPAHSMMVPGFVDTHVHAPQYAFTGTGYTLPLLSWLSTYTFPQERLFANLSQAEKVYPLAVARSLKCGTTTASWYGTIHVPATKRLAEICGQLGQRAFVGKVCMDRNGGEHYCETSHEQSLKETADFVDEILSLGNDNIKPILTPRFAVSCTGDLLAGLGRLAKDRQLPIQTHCAENLAECAFVQELFPSSKSYVDVYAQHDILGDRTVLAHCVHLSDEDRHMIKETGTGVAHCPVSNFALESGVCDVRSLLDAGCKVGLGTDVAGGWSLSIVEAMRSAIVASKVVGFGRPKDAHRALSLSEAFYLATLGGAQVLGLADRVGNFTVGKDFDALLVDLAAGSALTAGSRPIDIFEHDTTASLLEKFVFLGDDRHITEVYVSGKRVVSV
ncbi:hypothetical protein BC832DRAFT_530050 [Gaertneriomyces semiglobifer]|nr:hypothetical protein BC832DRAFT_530050 [Gaertneriomyces semiglobifer]